MTFFHRFQNFRQFSNLFSQIRLKKRHTSLFSGICREIRTKFHRKFAEKMQKSTQKQNLEIRYPFAKKWPLCWRFLAGGERFRGKSEKGFEKSMVAAGNGPSIANQRLLQYVTWKGKEVKWTSYPALKCILNLIWSVRGSMHADSKKGNVEKILKILARRWPGGNAFEASRKTSEKSKVVTENKPGLDKPTTTT